MKFVKRKQDETHQGTFREESLIQNNSWFSVRSEKRANFLLYKTQEVELIMRR